MKAGGSMENRSSKSSNVSIGMGGSLILTIFVVLCLTVFSVLSFTTAYSDLKLANKTEEFTSDYYKIHGTAEEKLAEIYEVLMSINENTSSVNTQQDAFITKASEAISKIYGVSEIKLNSESFTLYYEILGDKNQKICVTLEVLFDEEKSIPYFDILTWNLEPIELPVYEEENYDLWEGFENEN
ncbi:MAG: hypothetical protein K0R07_1379 [Sedimentibacter sp.]|jgi:hypothetical protein|nr:hypothetical protein [Sedimentibacter sp.]